MSNSFPMVHLRQVLKHRSEFIEIDDFQTYKRCRVQSHAQGVVERDEIPGTEIKTKRQQLCYANEFLVAEIDAKVGGFGIVPNDLDGAIVSSHYFLFTIDDKQIERNFLEFYIRTPHFIEQVRAKGSTNYAAIRPNDVLGYEIPLPSIEEQRRIVARIEELAAKIEEARGLRREAVEEGEKLDISYLSRQFDFSDSDTLPSHWNWYYLNEILINNNHGITTGPFGTLLQKSEIQLDGIPVVGIANVQRNKFSFGFNDYISLEKAEELANYKVYADDILIARSGTVGRSCVVPQGLYPDPVMSTNLIRLRLNTQLFLPELLCKLFNGSKLVETYKDANCYGSTRTFFTQKMLLNLRIPVPPIEQQMQIIVNLNKLQERIKVFNLHQTQTSAELNALLPSILDKAFKGEL